MSEDRDKTEELLSAYIDGEVTKEQSQAVEQAVAKDPELALELHEVTAAKRLVTGLPRERAPRGFVRRVMARAERKHLLGDHQAGGAFAASRWITLAVAAVVLLTAGIGMIAVSMLGTGQGSPTIAVDLNGDGGGPGGPKNPDISGGSLHGEGGKEGIGKVARGSVTTNGGTVGGRLFIADTAFNDALTNAKNTSIYTHDVSNTLVVLHETFDRNDVLPLELEAPARDSKPADKAAAEKRRVSRGGLNFYYNKKQDDQQVQIVVLATDTVIEQLNGDLDKLARVQMVSQAPAPDLYKVRSEGGFVARETGSPGAQKDTDPSNRDEEGVVIARVDGVHTGLGVTSGERKAGKGGGHRAKSKTAPEGGADRPSGKAAPAPVVPAAPEIAKPVVDPRVSGDDNGVRPSDVAAGEAGGIAPSGSKPPRKAVSQTGNAGQDNGPATAVTNAGGQKKESIGKGDKPKPVAPKQLVAGPTTRPRPAETVQVAGGIQKGFLDGKDSRELEILSALIAREQKHGKSIEQLEERYSKLNSAFRQEILNDDVRRNVQSQQERGINVRALVININRRNVRSPGGAATQSGIGLRDSQALSRPRATTKSSPVSESTTRQAAQPADTSR